MNIPEPKEAVLLKIQQQKRNHKPALIVAILFKNKGAIGGMSQRFCVVGASLIEQGCPVELLTTRSLLREFKVDKVQSTHCIEDDQQYISIGSWFMLLYLLTKIALGQYRQVHISGGGRLTSWIIKCCKLSGTTSSCTFASRTLDMASYGREVDKVKWTNLLDSVDRIDVLNPGHDLHPWKEKISISPCSFSSKMLQCSQSIPLEKSNIAVFCGSLEAIKNPMLALEIMEKYNDTVEEKVELVVFGKGVLEQDVRQKMEDVNKNAHRELFRFGSQGELMSVLSRANLFLSLQEQDNYPSQSIMEAMLLGCKAIATDVGDTRLLFSQDEPLNALVDSRSAHDFVDAVRDAFSDLSASDENARFIRHNHSIEKFSEYLKDFLELEA